MILVIQIAVIATAMSLLLFALIGRQTHAARAWKKIALSLLAVAMIVAVLFPHLVDAAAHSVGIGRGADLLLYTFVLVFIGYTLNNYLQKQRDKDALYRLARKVALLEASERHKIHTN